MKVFFATIFIICMALSVLSIRSLWILKDCKEDKHHNGVNVLEARKFSVITLAAMTTYILCYAVACFLILYLRG